MFKHFNMKSAKEFLEEKGSDYTLNYPPDRKLEVEKWLEEYAEQWKKLDYPEYPEGTRVITKFDDIKGIVEADYGHKIRMKYDSMSEGQSVTIHKNAVNKLI